MEEKFSALILLWQCWFVSSVTLYHDGERLASGVMSERSASVHGHPLLDSEVKVQVEEVLNAFAHPLYSYNVETDGFTAWEINSCF